MKTLLVFLCCLSVAVTCSIGQVVAPPVALDASQAQAQPQPQAQNAPQPFTAQELNQLLGPVALYPDSLIGLILPASTVPSDVVVADRYLAQNGDPAQIPNQPWDDSVKGLTHFPDVLKWLDDNLDWTSQLGSAYLAQPGDVMDAIQRLRAQARADGTLASNAQQQLATDSDGNITIEPTNPETVYVPQYDPSAVYDDEYTTDDGPVITYGVVYYAGPWLCFWPNWHRHCIFLGDWHRWHDFHGHLEFAKDGGAHPWHADPNRLRVQFQVKNSALAARPVIVSPQPQAGATIVRGRHTSAFAATGAGTRGFSTSPRVSSGRSVSVVTPPAGQAVAGRPVMVQTQTQAQVPQQGVNTGYARGIVARPATPAAVGERVETVRQSYGVAARPEVPVTPVYNRAPVETFTRPAAPVSQSVTVGAGASAGTGTGSGGRGEQGRYGH